MKPAFWPALFACGLLAFGDPPSPRDGWSLAANGQELICPGLWQCVEGLTVDSDGQIVLKTAGAYVTPINTIGPRLTIQVDFNPLASLSPRSGSSWVTLIGALGGGSGKQWWE